MPPGEPPTTALEPPVVAELRALVEKAGAGDVAVLPRMRGLLDNHPEIWERIGDLERVVVRAWTELLAGDDPLSREAVRRKAESLRAELEGDAPTPLERLLVGQVVSTWMELSHAQVCSAASGALTPAQARYHWQRAESAQKKHLAAVRTLTTLRALVPGGLLPVNHRLRLCEPERAPA